MTTTIASLEIARDAVIPEGPLDGRGALERGRILARSRRLQPSPFLNEKGVASELEWKRAAQASGRIMFHAQIGYRSLDDSRRAYADIWQKLEAAGGWGPDRYGICLDWSMGYPARERAGRPRGTGLILKREEDYAALTQEAPVAPHFGDFVLGMPAAVETVSGALEAGATTIGNLAQYFTFRLPGWTDDIATTIATVEALGLLAGQEREILVHSNLDDGYAAWFEDVASALGFAMVERGIVERLVGLPLGHCFGHTYSHPVKRLAFHIALSRANPNPGTMLYGNTTLYGAETTANYGALASYVLLDILALRRNHTGHAVTPIPVTEAERIPTPQEIVDVHLASRRLAERTVELEPLFDARPAAEMAEVLVDRGARFAARLMEGLDAAGFDLDDPAEMLLALRRIGPARLEAWLAEPPKPEAPVVASPFVDEIAALADDAIDAISTEERQRFAAKAPRVLVASTDVHFYGKRLIETVLGRLDAAIIDGGVSVDPDVLAETAAQSGASAIALSTYNGIALDFAQRLRGECARRGIAPQIYIGGRLNQIMEDTGSSLPVEVGDELRQLGLVTCLDVPSFVRHLGGASA